MKRIVLPLLLSTAYVALMTLLFSSPFGQENNFLFERPEFSASTNRLVNPDFSLLPEAPQSEVVLETTEAEPALKVDGNSPESAPD